MEVDNTWKNCIDGQKLPWIRMIEKHIGRLEQYPATWKKVTSKIPVKNVQELALAVQKFYVLYYSWTDWTPMHISAACGKLELCQYICEKMNEKNPEKLNGPTPFYLAANRGHYDVCKFIIENVDDKNPTAKDCDDISFHNDTPLDLAIKSNHLEVC